MSRQSHLVLFYKTHITYTKSCCRYFILMSMVSDIPYVVCLLSFVSYTSSHNRIYQSQLTAFWNGIIYNISLTHCSTFVLVYSTCFVADTSVYSLSADSHGTMSYIVAIQVAFICIWKVLLIHKYPGLEMNT